MTIVTVKASAATPHGDSAEHFRSVPLTCKRGPIDIPSFHAYVTDARGLGSAHAIAANQQRIRQLIPQEPEQTYERASREIPALDPWHRENGGRVYLPLAADSSWQKFAFEYGGNVFISKTRHQGQG